MAAATFSEEMFRERPHKIRLQLLTENDGLPVSAALSSYTHRLIAKVRHTDADADAVFNLTNVFTNEDDVNKVVEATIPTTATEHASVPEGRTTRLYLQWQTHDGTNPWIVADGHLTVRSSLPRSP